MRTLCGLCVLQSLWAFYLGILAETPNPFPVVKGCVCLVGSASCRAFWHTRPASVPGGGIRGLASLRPALGLRPKQGCFDCLPKVLHDAKLLASNKRHPHFQKTQRFIDRLKHPFEGVSDFFYNLLRAVKISPYFLYFFTFFMDKTCFCSVLYITRAVRHTVLPLRKEHYYEIIRKTH